MELSARRACAPVEIWQRMRVVDSHVHFWDPAAIRYPWLEQVPAIERAFLPYDYFASSDPDAVIFVEANCDTSETGSELSFVQRLATLEPRVKGIVAYANLLDAHALQKTLDTLLASQGVVGIRMNIQGEAPGFAVAPAFVHGVREVGRRGLVFDLCTTEDQLGETIGLVAQCPDMQFVLDHCGKPNIRDGPLDGWAKDIAHLAAFETVACKLSGLLTEAAPHQRTYEGIAQYLEHARQCFGPTRILYGSDWPVLTLAGGISTWRGVVDRFSATWSADDRQQLFSTNAERIYGIDL